MKPIFFRDENEMRFWMGIYQTSMQSSSSAPALSGCDWDPDAREKQKTPDKAADEAVHRLRERMPSAENATPGGKKYHNSPD